MSYRQSTYRNSLSATEKKIPPNPRYAHIKSKLDTGLTVDKVSFVTTREYLKHKDESFYRVTGSQLADLLTEYEQDLNEGIEDIVRQEIKTIDGPAVVIHTEESIPHYDRPYIILDLRETSQYLKYRILKSKSFPSALFNQDRMTAELYSFKNKPGTLIILYSDEERLSCDVAHTMVHRGFENVYVLTGGLNAFCENHPYFVEGLPEQTEPVKQSKNERRHKTASGSMYIRTTAGRAISASGSVPIVANSARSQVGSVNSHSKNSWGPSRDRRASRAPFQGDNVSVKSTMSVAETVISRAAARKTR